MSDDLTVLARQLEAAATLKIALTDGVEWVNLLSDDNSVGDWLDLYLYAYAPASRPRPGGRTIVHARSSEARDSLRRILDGAHFPATRVPYRHGRTAMAYDFGSRRVIAPEDGKASEFLIVDDDRIVVLCERPQLVSGIVRDILTRCGENRGELQLQCTVLRHEGRGVVLCATAGRGKTAVLLSLLHKTAGVDLLSHDRVLVRADAGGVSLRPWPTAFLVDWTLILKYPEIRDAYGRGHRPPYPQETFWRPDDLAAAGRGPDRRQVEMMPCELATFFGIDLVPAMLPARRIFFYSRDEGRRPPADLDPVETETRLARLFFDYGEDFYPDTLGLRDFDGDEHRRRIEWAAREMAKACPAVHIFEPDDDRIADTVIEALGDTPRSASRVGVA